MITIELDLQTTEIESEATHILVLDKKEAKDFESGKVYSFMKVYTEHLARNENDEWSKRYVYSNFIYLRANAKIN